MSAEKRETLSSIYSELSTNSLKANIRNQVKYSVDSNKSRSSRVKNCYGVILVKCANKTAKTDELFCFIKSVR